MNTSILAPAAVLVLWTLVILVWLATARLPAISKMGIDLGKTVGGRGSDLDPNLPPPVAWKSHNYTHLMEQPTIFYATIMILAIADAATPFLVAIAWGYTGIRIVHSIWQVTVNKVSIRFMLFMLATLCLAILAISAVLATI